jgi:hypothetical protein
MTDGHDNFSPSLVDGDAARTYRERADDARR